MPYPIGGPTTALVGLALDAASLRQQATANNIANAATPGHRYASVRFEEFFTEAKAALRQGQGVTPAMLEGTRPVMDLAEPDAVDSSSVVLDAEVARLSTNTLQQQVLLKMLNRHYGILSTAVQEGRR